MNINTKKIKQFLTPYVFISPFFILFIVFMLYPLIYSLVLSFSKWTSKSQDFVGIDNFTHLFTDSLFWKSLLNTFQLLLVQVPFMLLIAITIAVLFNSSYLKFKSVFRLAIFMPVLIDLISYSLVFSLLFNETYGTINQVLKVFGIPPISWLLDGFWAKVLIIIAVTWRWTGYNAIIILSGLQMIPKDLYEAAKIDGSNVLNTFFRLTIPMLRPVLLFCIVLSTIGTFQLFVEPYVLTRGGPNNETKTVMFYLYETAFKTFNFGLASAGAYVITIFIAILAYFQLKISKGGEI